MSLEVNLEISFCCKPIATYVALKGSLSSVGSNVNLESRVTSKYLTAVPAPMLIIRIFVIGFMVINETIG